MTDRWASKEDQEKFFTKSTKALNENDGELPLSCDDKEKKDEPIDAEVDVIDDFFLMFISMKTVVRIVIDS